MKKEQIIISIMLITMTAFLTGCQDKGPSGSPFVGGPAGLEMSFIQGNPPDAIFDDSGSSFAIVVDLQNIGEDTIEPGEGYIKINGLDPGTFGISSFKKRFEDQILGARKNFDGTVLNGGRAQIEFGDLKYTRVISGNIEHTVWADLCYKYTTKATTQLCIKTSPELLVDDGKICTVEGEKYPQNSGAPVQVTSLKETFAGNGKIGVTMVIEHIGNGDRMFKDTESECDDTESNSNKDKVHIKVMPVNINGKEITPKCTGLSDSISANEGYVRLSKDGSGNERYPLTCTIDVGQSESIFEVPIDLELTYMYLQHISKPMIVRHAVR